MDPSKMIKDLGSIGKETFGKSCIFCRIVKGDIPCTKLFEGPEYIAFLDISPATKGHALIVAKEHRETMAELPEPTLTSMMAFAQKLSRALSSSLGAEGFNILINNKAVAGQVIPHAHIHVIPRYKGDGLRIHWEVRKDFLPILKDLAEKIRTFL
ncbi:HIT family protein [Candidatus Woesearchaeota archaeon]|nr:HIT family protein [Candidatus Woesearchaeota archaeon]